MNKDIREILEKLEAKDPYYNWIDYKDVISEADLKEFKEEKLYDR